MSRNWLEKELGLKYREYQIQRHSGVKEFLRTEKQQKIPLGWRGRRIIRTVRLRGPNPIPSTKPCPDNDARDLAVPLIVVQSKYTVQ